LAKYFVIREKLENKILDLLSENVDRKKLILNNKNYLYYPTDKEKKLYLTDMNGDNRAI
jgi:hypothetical protein